MSIYAIVIDDENLSLVKERLIRAYDDHYAFKHDEHIFLVRRKNGMVSEVAHKVGIKGENAVGSGVVFKLDPSAYSGYTDRDLWDWIGKDDCRCAD